MRKSVKKKDFKKAIVRFFKKLKWRYEFLIEGPLMTQVDLGGKC